MHTGPVRQVLSRSIWAKSALSTMPSVPPAGGRAGCHLSRLRDRKSFAARATVRVVMMKMETDHADCSLELLNVPEKKA